MTDEELGRRLRDELHLRIDPPAAAPQAIHDHVRNLRSMQEVRLGVVGSRPHTLRNLFGIAAAIAIVALIGTGLLTWQALKTEPGTTLPAGGIEMFGRVNATTAWAESGSDLYITRDGGTTWAHGTLPGGLSFGQYQDEMNNRPASPAVGAGSTNGPDHLYPVFIDADHGWLLSWVANTPNGQSTVWTLTVNRTSDGGKTWQSARLPGTYHGYGVLQFADTEHGWVSVYRMDAAASSTGANVSGPYSSPVPPTAAPTAAPARPDETTILATSDGGATWAPVSTQSSQAIVRFVSPTEGWGYAHSTVTNKYVILHSTDSGRTWAQAALPAPDGYVSVAAPDAPVRSNGALKLLVTYQQGSSRSVGNDPSLQSSYAVLTFASTDDGKTWTLESTQPVDGIVFNGEASAMLQMPSGQPVVTYQAGSNSAGLSSMPLTASFDGGLTWVHCLTDGLPSAILMAQWTSPDDVWVIVGSSAGKLGSGLYASHDAGKTWTALLGAPIAPVASGPTPIATLPPLIVPTVSADPNQSFPPKTGGWTGPSIVSTGRVDASVGWVVVAPDAKGLLDLRITTDGGATWSAARRLPASADVQFVDALHGWTRPESTFGETANSATVYRTADGGVTWTPSTISFGSIKGEPGNAMDLMSFHFRDALHGEFFAALGVGPTAMPSTPTPSPSALPVCEQFSTSDGGVTWSTPKKAPCMFGTNFTSSSFGYGTVLLSRPVTDVTVDGGATWTEGSLPLPTGVQLSAGDLVSVLLIEQRSDGSLRALIQWVNGNRPTTMTIASSDNGRTWTDVGTVDNWNPNNYQFSRLSDGRWLALGQVAVPGPLNSGTKPYTIDAWSTQDGGATWQHASIEGLPAWPLASAQFTSPTDGWVAAADQSCTYPQAGQVNCVPGPWALYVTKDGGARWKSAFAP